MKVLAVLALVCATFVYATAIPAVAQERVLYLGGFAGYGMNAHISNFKALPAVPCCSPGFDGGSGSGIGVGVVAGYRFTEKASLQVRAGYAGLHGMLLRDEVIGNTRVRQATVPFDTVTVDIVSQHSIEATLHTLMLEPAVVWTPVNRFNVHAGIAGAVVLRSHFRQKEQLQSPSTVVFTESGSRTRNEAAASIPNGAPVLWYAVAGASWDATVAPHTVLSPEVRLHFPLNNLASVDWSVLRLSAGVALSVDIISHPPELRRDTIWQRDTVQRVVLDAVAESVELIDETLYTALDSVPPYALTVVRRERYRRTSPAERPVAALGLAGIDADGEYTTTATIVVEEVQAQESFPLLPYVFFQRGAADLNASFQRTVRAVSEFDTTELQFSAFAVYANMLNILAARMHKFPDATIVITGCRSDDEDTPDLAERRARAVQHYLQSAGGIDSSRIAVKWRGLPASPSNTTTEDGRAENCRAEITVSDSRLLAPMALRTVERTATMPALECLPRVVSSDYTSWRLVVKSANSKTVLIDTVSSGEPAPIRLQPSAHALLSDTALVGAYTITARNGLVGFAESKLLLQRNTVARRRNDSTNIEIERFALVLFDYNSTGIDDANELILQHVRSRIQPDSRVRIVGYTDRTGDADYNQKLAERRCRQVYRQLGFSDAEIEAVGSSRLLFDNNSPHGRMYSRTVHIVIETPVRNTSIGQ